MYGVNDGNQGLWAHPQKRQGEAKEDERTAFALADAQQLVFFVRRLGDATLVEWAQGACLLCSFTAVAGAVAAHEPRLRLLISSDAMYCMSSHVM